MHWLICNRYMMQRYLYPTIIAYVTQKHDDDEDPGRATRFDTDSVPIRIDNCCSQSLSHDILDFIPDTIHDSPQRVTIKGFGNSSTPILQCGTIQWRILDDNGNERNIIIPNSYYVPSSGVRLLSFHHWAQETSQVYNHGIVCITYGDQIILKWDRQTYQKTVTIIPTSCNTGVMWTVPNNSKYTAFHSLLLTKGLHTIASPPSHPLIYVEVTNTDDIMESIDDDDDMLNGELDLEEREIIRDNTRQIPAHHERALRNAENQKLEAELLLYHHRFEHVSFSKLQAMARLGMIPKRLSHVLF
jgi:hypothetical protein